MTHSKLIIQLCLLILIDFKTHAQVPSTYTVVENWDDSLKLISREGKFGLFNVSFNEAIVLPKYDKIEPFGKLDDRLAVVHYKGKLGIIDKNGFEILKPAFDEFGIPNELKEGWLIIKKKGKIGIVTLPDGWIILEPQYKSFEPFGKIHQSLALVKKDNLYGLMDESAFLSLSCQYDEIRPFGELHPERALVKRKGKWGLMGLEGGEMISCEYDKIESYSNESFKGTKGNEIVYFDAFGLEFIP